MTSIPPTNLSLYQLLIFWTQILHLMAIQMITNMLEAYYPFLGGGLSWPLGIATSKDVNSSKKRVNQLIATQSTQEEAIVHIVSILNITRYAAQANRQI